MSHQALWDKIKNTPLLQFMQVETVSIETGSATLKITSHPNNQQQHGFIHGGAIATLLDTTAGLAAFSVVDKKYTLLTAELKINYIRPAQGILTCIGTVLNHGKNLMVVEAKLINSDNQLVSIALGTMAKVELATIN